MFRGVNRRFRGVFILWAALLLVLPASGVGATGVTAVLSGAPALNFLRNSSFVGADYWILKGEGTRFDERGGRSGDGAVVMYPEIDPSAEMVQTVGPTLEPGVRYTVTAWVKALSPGSVAVVGVRWEGGHPRVFRGIEPEDGWVKIEFRFDAPSRPGWRQVVLSGSGRGWCGTTWGCMRPTRSKSARPGVGGETLLGPIPSTPGLVINAKGTDLQRGMSPRIWDENGQLVFAGIEAGETQI